MLRFSENGKLLFCVIGLLSGCAAQRIDDSQPKSLHSNQPDLRREPGAESALTAPARNCDINAFEKLLQEIFTRLDRGISLEDFRDSMNQRPCVEESKVVSTPHPQIKNYEYAMVKFVEFDCFHAGVLSSIAKQIIKKKGETRRIVYDQQRYEKWAETFAVRFLFQRIEVEFYTSPSGCIMSLATTLKN